MPGLALWLCCTFAVGVPPSADGVAAPSTHALYFVVPNVVKTFDEAKRKQLGVQGPLKTHWPQRHRFRHKHGFLAWLSPAEVEAARQHPDVVEVLPYLPDDVVAAERPRGIVRNYLDVHLSPNDWPTNVDRQTFQSSASLYEQWRKRFQDDSAVTVELDAARNVVRFTIVGVKPDPEISAVVRHSGQVQFMHWSQDPSTVK